MKKIFIIILLCLPSFGFAQFSSDQDSLMYVKKIYDDYHMVNNDVGCLLGGGSFTFLAGALYGMLLSTTNNENESKVGRSVIFGSVIGGATLITLSYTIKAKHKPKYKKYRMYYQ